MDKNVAEILLKIGAVFIRPNEPFTWASGIKSPVYCDNRLILSDPSSRVIVENYISDVVKHEFSDVDIIIGTSTAGIPHAAIVADYLDLPMGYVRSSNKDHGRENKIEGKVPFGSKVVVIEDLISTGGSVIEVVNALKDAGAIVIGVISIFTYNMKKSIDLFKEMNLEVVSLTNFDVIASVAVEKNYIKEEEINKLIAFRNDPSDERWLNA